MRTPSFTSEQTKELKELFDSGKTINQLATYFGVSHATVKNYLDKSEHKQVDLEAKKIESLMASYPPTLQQKYDTLGRLYIELLVTKEIDKFKMKNSTDNFRVDPYA